MQTLITSYRCHRVSSLRLSLCVRSRSTFLEPNEQPTETGPIAAHGPNTYLALQSVQIVESGISYLLR